MQLCFLCNISLFFNWDICFFLIHYLCGIYVGILLIPFFSQPKYKLELFKGSSLSKRLFFLVLIFQAPVIVADSIKYIFWLPNGNNPFSGLRFDCMSCVGWLSLCSALLEVGPGLSHFLLIVLAEFCPCVWFFASSSEGLMMLLLFTPGNGVLELVGELSRIQIINRAGIKTMFLA